jgi:hypothetical protein
MTAPDLRAIAEKDAGPIHFWDPESGGALHTFARPSEAVFSDDLRVVNCDACRSTLIEAVRAQQARRLAERVTPPGGPDA